MDVVGYSIVAVDDFVARVILWVYLIAAAIVVATVNVAVAVAATDIIFVVVDFVAA